MMSMVRHQNSENEHDNEDIDGDMAEFELLLAAAEEGQTDEVSRILGKDPELILTGDLVEGSVLHIAAREGHEDTVLKLIKIMEQHPQLEKVLCEGNADGNTALHLAIKNGHMKAAEHLVMAQKNERFIHSTAAWSVANNDGFTPWDLAKHSGFEPLLRLIDSFVSYQCFGTVDMEMTLACKIFWEDEGLEERLSGALTAGLEDEVQSILDEDPTLVRHVHDIEGTALHVAARAGQEGTLRQLIQFIADDSELTSCGLLLQTDVFGDTALQTALKNGLTTAARYLVEIVPQAVYQVNKSGVSPLYLAVQKELEDLVRYMIIQTSSVSQSMKHSLLSHAKKASLAHAAIKTSNLGTLQVLMEELPSLINSSDKKGWKPLSYAANKGYIDQVCYLLKKFPEAVEKSDRDGSFPIHKAVAGGKLSIVLEFITHFPRALHAIDKKGRNILHIAVRYAKKDILSYLTKEKDIKKIFNLKDNEGKTFEDMARQLI